MSPTSTPENDPRHSHDYDAERAVLGGMMHFGREGVDLAASLAADDFGSTKHQTIFAAARRLSEAGQIVDPITLTNELTRAKLLKQVGGAAYIHDLPDAAPTISAQMPAHVAILKECHLRRELAKLAEDIAALASADIATEQAFSVAAQCVEQGRERCRPRVRIDAPDLAGLLDELVAFATTYVVFASDAQPDAVALWIAHTHLLERFDLSPYLAVTSPEKRSGKTRLLDVLELLVARPWRAILPSDAVLFRKVDATRPTLLLDEVDTIFGPRAGNYEGLRALLNAGHSRGTTVPRCVGEGAKMEVRDFSVFCAKALAGIGKLPDTVADRSIPIRLARRRPSETVAKFRNKVAKEQGAPLCEALESIDIEPQHDADVPAGLDDRAADCWAPLIQIAAEAGGDWPARARRAAIALSSGCDVEDESLPIVLLFDCRRVFDADNADRLPTEDLTAALHAVPESPWNDLHGRALTARGLSRMLRPYGIASRQHRFGEKTCKGYLRTDFMEAWTRYLPGNDILSETCETPQVDGLNAESGKETPQVDGVRAVSALTCGVSDSETAPKPLTSNVSDVSDRKGFPGDGAKMDRASARQMMVDGFGAKPSTEPVVLS